MFLAGERADPDTVDWCERALGVPVIDHWWQTELGYPAVANPVGIELLPTKYGSPALPMPGYAMKILDEAADRDRTSAAPLKALGVALLHQGQLETAVKILWFALEKSPYDRDLNATLNALAPESHPV